MNAVSFDFIGSNVLVTGGTSGIGHAIATGFAKAGAAVTITRADRPTGPRMSRCRFLWHG